jgi:cytochrome c oxidase cbb3-type subunit I/II
MNSHANLPTEQFSYNDQVVKKFAMATVIWAVVGMLVGVYLALELANYHLNLGLPWLTFGRLRPLHTNAIIFAFCGNALFAGVYHSTQRLLKARLFSDLLGNIHFWGWQFIIVLAAITLPLGITSGKEYAELEWPIDILIAVIWVVFAVNFFGTIYKRRERHLYVAIWFYIATIITVALLHIVNSIEIPVSLMKSYPVYAGVQDALVQWWYGHNAVAFFLTTPFLGIMYYYLPKAAGKPVYSYKLSIIHFWSLVFLYIWTGPHHLLNSSLPDWLQTVGMVFSLMLWAPSWGGMINGLLTLRGAWDKVRKEPVLKFFATSVTFYGMSTFEGPLLSIKSVNALAHNTDWIVGHVHAGGVGWNYFLIAGMLYFMVPRLWKTEIYSKEMANKQFWMGTIGLLLYVVSMYISGITQGLMWRGVKASGELIYPDFVETVTKIIPMYWVRAVGGTLILISALMMLYNIFKTIQKAPKGQEEEQDSAQAIGPTLEVGSFHRRIEGWSDIFSVFVVIAVITGSIASIVPSFLSKKIVKVSERVQPYTPLELLGRDIYIKEGCYNCHTQMIRPLLAETIRYGNPTRAEESGYDHPFQWGSRRIGPDLARVGNKYSHMWHFRHMYKPQDVVKGSIMPPYPWLFRTKISYETLSKKLKVMKAMGVPYSQNEIDNGVALAKAQAAKITASMKEEGVAATLANKEIIALIAYLQKLGHGDIKEEQ